MTLSITYPEFEAACLRETDKHIRMEYIGPSSVHITYPIGYDNELPILAPEDRIFRFDAAFCIMPDNAIRLTLLYPTDIISEIALHLHSRINRLVGEMNNATYIPFIEYDDGDYIFHFDRVPKIGKLLQFIRLQQIIFTNTELTVHFRYV